MWPIGSAQVSSLAKNFFIAQFQKLMILSQKNIPPPKKALFGRGLEITRPLNPSITWPEKEKQQTFICNSILYSESKLCVNIQHIALKAKFFIFFSEILFCILHQHCV